MKLYLFQKQLRHKNIDLVFLVHPDSSITYFTQTKPSFAYLTITPQNSCLYLTKLDSVPKFKRITTEVLKKNWEKKMTSIKIKKVGINKESLSVAFLEKLAKIFPRAEFIDISLLLKELRMQKTPEEIKKIAKSCAITSEAFNSLIEELEQKTLHTEQEAASFLERRISSAGAALAFPPIVALGKNAAIPHHQTSNQKLRRGFLLIDFGACYQNYCADMTRVLFLGNLTRVEKDYYNLLLEAQSATIKEIKLEKSFSELNTLARKYLGKYSSNFIHSLGHGIGINVHEAPAFSDEKQKIKENQVFTIEPGIYFPGKFGLRIEDTILFNKKPIILTKVPKELVKIKI